MESAQPDPFRARPKVLHTISGNIHFYEHSNSSRQARRALSTHAGSTSRGSQHGRASTTHSSWDFLIPSTRPDENQKPDKNVPKPVFLERCLSKNGSSGLENCPAFSYLQSIEWNERPKDPKSPKYQGWERIPGMLSNTEFDSEKYKLYRSRDRRGHHKGTNVTIWTHENEDAFQIAVRIVPVVGKRKFNQAKTGDNPGTTGKGRNEVIGQVIERLTGVRLLRKQISSHIQVLTGFMDHGGEWLKAVRHDELREQARRAAIRLYNEADDQICLVPSKDKDGNAVKRECAFLRPILRSPSGRLSSSNSRPVRPSVKRLELDTRVWLEKPPSSGDWREIYSFTSMQSERGAAPIVMEDLQNWQSLFPDLAKAHESYGKIDGEVVDIQANFKLEEMPAKSHLGIQVFVDLAHTAGYSNWRYSTRFYSSVGKAVYVCANDFKPSPIRGSSQIRLEIPLESKWWVNVLWRFSRQRSAALAQGTVEALQQEECRTRRELQGMSVSQEIFATDAFGCERRLTTLLWRFNQTTGDEVATTVWRKVIQHQFRHAPLSPKVGSYENLQTNDLLSIETATTEGGEQGLLLPSIEDAPARLRHELEWFNQSTDIEQCRVDVGDDLFGISQPHQATHLQATQYTDNPIGTTEAPTSQPFESTAWEPASCAYPSAYEDPPYDYEHHLALDENPLDRVGSDPAVEEHDLYQSHATADHHLDDFTGGEIRLQYSLDDAALHPDVHIAQFGPQDPSLHDLGLDSAHQGVLHAMLDSHPPPDELVLDPAFSDPNHAINAAYHYPTLALSPSVSSSFPTTAAVTVPAYPSPSPPHMEAPYIPPAVSSAQILPSQPEEAQPTPSDSSLSQSTRTDTASSSQLTELMVLPSQHDGDDHYGSAHTHAIDGLHFLDDEWDPNLVPHLFDAADFHATALEILGTEIVGAEGIGLLGGEGGVGFCGRGGGGGEVEEMRGARVLGEVGVDVAEEEAKDWVLVKGLEGLDGTM